MTFDPELSDGALATAIADAVASQLADMRASVEIDPEDRAAVTALKDQADVLAHNIIVDAFALTRPQDMVMSEEGNWRDLGRVTHDRVWIVDPLDGTTEFGMGLDHWAVQIALWDRGALTHGAVTLGARRRTWSTDHSARAVPTGGWPLHRDGTLSVVVSRTRRPEGLDATMERLVTSLAPWGVRDYDVLNIGSIGGKVDEVLVGNAQLYIGPSWCYEWDVAAPSAVAIHEGLVATDFDGNALVFNKPEPEMTGLLVGPPVLVDAWIAATREGSTSP